ncbi:hypothetical protein ACWCYZ_38485 [Streptomyces virginiae]
MPTVTEISPSDLQAVPEISAVIHRHGWGSLASGVVAFPGRNDNWAGTTSAGVGVFVKKISGPDAAARFRRALSFTQLGPAQAGIASPACIAADEASRVLVFELLEGARDGNTLEQGGLFTPPWRTRRGAPSAACTGCRHRARPWTQQSPPGPAWAD